MKQKMESLMLVLVGLINLIPVLGVFSASQMAQTYAIDIDTTDLELLMRHRALLFGIIGGFVLVAVIKPSYRPPAMMMAGVSMSGFMVLTLMLTGINDALYKIFWADVLGLGCLLVAVILSLYNKNSRP